MKRWLGQVDRSTTPRPMRGILSQCLQQQYRQKLAFTFLRQSHHHAAALSVRLSVRLCVPSPGVPAHRHLVAKWQRQAAEPPHSLAAKPEEAGAFPEVLRPSPSPCLQENLPGRKLRSKAHPKVEVSF